MNLIDLLAQPESKTLEFKRDISSLDQIIKTIIAFANTAGGILIIGRAPTGELVGLQDLFRAEEALASAIADNIHPSLLPEIEIATVDGKNLLVVRVPHWRAPFYMKKLGMPGGVYVRLGSTSRPAGSDILIELQRSALTTSFDQRPLPELNQQALDLRQASSLFQALGKELSLPQLRSLGALVPYAGRTVPSVGGLILLGTKEAREQWVPDARVSCARFYGETKARILDQYHVEGTILDAVTEVPKFIARNTRLVAHFGAMQRQDIPEYPVVAIREVLINALVHADYSVAGSHIQIAIFSDRLEIQSPGMLPFGFTLDDLKMGVSRVRNRVIVRFFHELQLMEEWGSGYKRVLQACLIGGCKEPIWEELGSVLRVTFFPYVESFLAQETQASPFEREIFEREVVILNLFQGGESLPFREIFQRLSIPISERTLRYDLAQLKERGLLNCRGKGRGVVWRRN